MPTYEYECEACGIRFERFQKMTDPPESACPDCRGPVRRLIGAGAGILFRGGGFYITDYRSKEYRESAKAERPAAGAGGSGDGKEKSGDAGKGTGDSKPDPAPASETTPKGREPEGPRKSAPKKGD